MIALIAVMTVIALVLVVLAFERIQRNPASGEVAPVPTFSLGVTPAPTASSTPTPTATPVEESSERFLTTSDSGILWRGVAGSCADGVSPSLERSEDGGQTWEDVTPQYLGITQIAAIAATGTATQATIVASIGEDCRLQGLRTFTDGEFWEVYEDVLPSATYLSFGETAQLMTSGATVDTPCAEPRSARGADGRVALVCDGEAQTFQDGEWAALDVPGAIAVAVQDDAVVVAHAADSCDGIALSVVRDDSGPVDTGCAEGLDPGSPTAIASDGDAIMVWSGDQMASIGLGG